MTPKNKEILLFEAPTHAHAGTSEQTSSRWVLYGAMKRSTAMRSLGPHDGKCLVETVEQARVGAEFAVTSSDQT